MTAEINPFDILSGKVAQTKNGTYWFKEAGDNLRLSSSDFTKNLHREDGPAALWPGGSVSWYKNGQLHRLDGPAITEVNGIHEWYKDGKRHRLDGPAVYGGYSVKRWYIEGIYYNEHDFNNKVKCMTK